MVGESRLEAGEEGLRVEGAIACGEVEDKIEGLGEGSSYRNVGEIYESVLQVASFGRAVAGGEVVKARDYQQNSGYKKRIELKHAEPYTYSASYRIRFKSPSVVNYESV